LVDSLEKTSDDCIRTFTRRRIDEIDKQLKEVYGIILPIFNKERTTE